MIQLAALPASTAPTPPPGLIAPQNANGSANGGFSRVLALLQGGGAAPEGRAEAPGDSAAAPVQTLAGRQAIAGIDAAGGKILPLGELTLPGMVPAVPVTVTGAADEVPVEAAGTTAALRLKPAASTLPALLAAVRTIQVPVALSPSRGEQPSEDEAAPAAEAQDAPVLTAAMAAITPAPAPEAARGEAAAFAASAPVSAPVLPALIDAQMRGLPLAEGKAKAAPVTAEAKAEGAEAIRMLPVSAMRPDAAPAAFTLGEAGAQVVGKALRLRAELGEPAKAAVFVTGADLAGPAFATPAQQGPLDTSASAIGAASPPGAVSAPQDFGTLVDRLIEARDAAAPVGVDVAVNHAEFGKVSLHFRQEGGGLSVSVASADPDFARAVQAAVPPPGAGAGAENMGQNAQGSSPQAFIRQDGASGQNTGPGNGQNSGQNNGQALGRNGQPAANRRAERAADETTASDGANGRGRFA